MSPRKLTTQEKLALRGLYVMREGAPLTGIPSDPANVIGLGPKTFHRLAREGLIDVYGGKVFLSPAGCGVLLDATGSLP